MAADREAVAPRKLTEAETSSLRSLLKSQLRIPLPSTSSSQQAEEDAGDLLDYAFAMIANGKKVGYVVEELTSMEMEVCDSQAANKLGNKLALYMSGLDENIGGEKEVATAPKVKTASSVDGKGNALANSGALGASRSAAGGRGVGARGKNKVLNRSVAPGSSHNGAPDGSSNGGSGGDRNGRKGGNALAALGALGVSRAAGGGREGASGTNNRPSPGKQSQQHGSSVPGGGGGSRSLHGRAFDRLREQAIREQQHQQEPNRRHPGERGRDDRSGGRDGGRNNARQGRGENDRGVGGGSGRAGRNFVSRGGGGRMGPPRGGGRDVGGRDGRHVQSPGRLSGRRRGREENESFIPVEQQNRNPSRGGSRGDNSGVFDGRNTGRGGLSHHSSSARGGNGGGWDGGGRGGRGGRNLDGVGVPGGRGGGGRGGGRFAPGPRGGRESRSSGRFGRGSGSEKVQNSQIKRARFSSDQQYPHEDNNYDNGGNNVEEFIKEGGDGNESWPSGRGRGRGDRGGGRASVGGRSWTRGGPRGGRGRGEGRGGRSFQSGYNNGVDTNEKQATGGHYDDTPAFSNNATAEAAAVSESPLIAASFGHAVETSYRGRGRGRLGRGFTGRGGRGRDGGAGRAVVVDMITSKTWVRPRTMDEGLTTKR